MERGSGAYVTRFFHRSLAQTKRIEVTVSRQTNLIPYDAQYIALSARMEAA
jgi:hypothetical protein